MQNNSLIQPYMIQRTVLYMVENPYEASFKNYLQVRFKVYGFLTIICHRHNMKLHEIHSSILLVSLL
jgi:hypothetical protein